MLVNKFYSQVLFASILLALFSINQLKPKRKLGGQQCGPLDDKMFLASSMLISMTSINSSSTPPPEKNKLNIFIRFTKCSTYHDWIYLDPFSDHL